MSGDKSSMDAISTASFTPALRRQDTGAREVMVQLTRSNTAGSISSEDAEAEELRELMHGSNLSMLSDHQWDLLLKEEAGAQRLDKLRQALTAATSSVIAPPRLGTEFLRLRRRLALHAAMTRLNRAARVIQRHYRGKRTREMTARRHRQLAEWNVQSAEKWWQRSNLIPQTLLPTTKGSLISGTPLVCVWPEEPQKYRDAVPIRKRREHYPMDKKWDVFCVVCFYCSVIQENVFLTEMKLLSFMKSIFFSCTCEYTGNIIS